MRKTVTYLVVVSVALLFTGCAAMTISPVPGVLYTEIKAPEGALAAPVGEVATYSKVGSASCTSILGLIATGDASVAEAMANGGITKIHHVDYAGDNILGVVAKYTVIVYGE
jgi:hypothetical protein